ncbi:hypothetical protein [Neptuniibacter marinus]|uniref:hypothetical protein n=1 Tax=Neptuniibacter marinus TaxID=1806670 RepID=UPI003B598EEE
MKQRVNLYNSNKSKQKFDPLSYSGSLTLVGTIVVLFLVVGLGLTVYTNYQQGQLEALISDQKKLKAAVNTEQARFSLKEANAELIVEKQRIQSQIASRQQLKNLLYRIQPSHGTSFSSYLYALAESSQPDSWLIEFQLDNTQHRFSAYGGAVEAPAVPVLLEAVSRTEVFQGLSIGELDLESGESGVLFKATAELRAYE